MWKFDNVEWDGFGLRLMPNDMLRQTVRIWPCLRLHRLTEATTPKATISGSFLTGHRPRQSIEGVRASSGRFEAK